MRMGCTHFLSFLLMERGLHTFHERLQRQPLVVRRKARTLLLLFWKTYPVSKAFYGLMADTRPLSSFLRDVYMPMP